MDARRQAPTIPSLRDSPSAMPGAASANSGRLANTVLRISLPGQPPILSARPPRRDAALDGVEVEQAEEQQVDHAGEGRVREGDEVVAAQVVEEAALPRAERHADPAGEHHHADRKAGAPRR